MTYWEKIDNAPSTFTEEVRGTGELKEAYRGWVEKALEGSGLERRPEWTESIAVGSESFLGAIKERLGIRAKGRKVAGGESRFELREGFAPYFHVFRGENVGLREKTLSFGGKHLENQHLSLVRPQQNERILGDSDFVDSVLAQAEEPYTRQCALRRRGYDLEKIAERVGEIYGIKVGEVFARGRQQRRVSARSLFCFWAVREMGNSLASLAIRLGISPAGVGYAVQRGEAIAHENGYQLTQ